MGKIGAVTAMLLVGGLVTAGCSLLFPPPTPVEFPTRDATALYLATTPTALPTATASETAIPSATVTSSTATSAASPTRRGGPTATRTLRPSATPTATRTLRPPATPTRTRTPRTTATNTPTRAPVATAAPPTPATSTPVPAPNIPAGDAQYTECFACHGPGELPSIPDHSRMADDKNVCLQCHVQGK